MWMWKCISSMDCGLNWYLLFLWKKMENGWDWKWIKEVLFILRKKNALFLRFSENLICQLFTLPFWFDRIPCSSSPLIKLLNCPLLPIRPSFLLDDIFLHFCYLSVFLSPPPPLISPIFFFLLPLFCNLSLIMAL